MANPSPNFRIGPVKLLVLCLLFLMAYGLALVVFMPAGWAWRWVSGEVQLPAGLTVNQVGGTLWHGQALMRYQRLPLHIGWDIKASQLWHGRLPVDWRAGTGQSRVHGQVRVSMNRQLALRARGRLHMADFSRLVRAQGGAQLAGNVSIERFSLGWWPRGWRSADGLARWPGGLVTWPMNGRQQQTTMPAMQARLSLDRGALDVRLSKSGSSKPAARVVLAPSGVMNLTLYRRLLDMAGQSWPESVPPDGMVFNMRQQVLPPMIGKGL